MKKIYSLQLLNNKYYIGIISNLDRRIREYFDGYGSQWIKLNNPIKINNLEYNPIFDDDKYIKMYIDKYKNKKYNSFIKINLNNIQKITIKCSFW
jgi:predicted GIY-YIG superfamily endonuclease